MSSLNPPALSQSLPTGYDKTVYYVSCETAQVNPIALNLHIDKSMAEWGDTGRGKKIEVISCAVQNSELTLTDKKGITYKFVPLTITAFEKFVRNHVAGPVPHFNTDEELRKYYREQSF